jgi:hypothetical protein
MSIGNEDAEKVVDMCREALKTHLIAHEAMYVDEK